MNAAIAGTLLTLSGTALTGQETITAGGYLSPESYPGMTLAWRDEFDGARLDPDIWSHREGNGVNGWGNRELQYYRAENTRLQDGYLVITAQMKNHGGQAFTSSRIDSRGKRTFTFGRIDIRARLPEGQGLWPALWLLGETYPDIRWPFSGEIDIMEMVGGSGREDTVHGTLHWAEEGAHRFESGSLQLPGDRFTGQFHVFSVVREEFRIRWLVDDRPFFEFDIRSREFDAFRQPFFVLINLAVGGDWPGAPDASTTFPQRFIVDYVRVFALAED